MSSLIKKLSLIEGLTKQKTNENVGWLQPSSTPFKKCARNKLLTPRQIMRTKKLKKFRNDYMTACIPAIRSSIYTLSWWGFLPMNLADLSPDNIGIVISEWSSGRAYHKLPDFLAHLSLPAQLKYCADRHRSYLGGIQHHYALDERFDTTEGTEQDGLRLIKLLLAYVKVRGGLAKYMLQASTNRPDLCGAVTKSLGGYQTWPLVDKGCPARICQFCGLCNVYSHFDHPTKPLRSNHIELSVQETYDDQFLTEDDGWEIINGTLINNFPIAWRCGWCGANLAVEPVRPFDFTASIIYDQIPSWFIGGQLDQFLKSGDNTDFYADLSAHDKHSIDEHDLLIVRRMLHRLWKGDVLIPTNTSIVQKMELGLIIPQIELVPSIRANCNCPSLFTELSVFTGHMRSLMGAEQTAIVGSVINLKDDDCTTHTRYSPWLMDEVVVTSNVFSRLCGPAALSDFLHNIVDFADQNMGMYLIIPLIKGSREESVTSIVHTSDSSYWMVNTKPHGLELNTATLLALQGDVIQVGVRYHYILPILTGNFCRLVYLTKSLPIVPGRFTWHTVNTSLKISLPLPCVFNKDEKDHLSVGLKVVNKDLNVELFRALCVRNINGSMEFNALCQYAIAFNMRRYTTGHTILKQQHIDYDLMQFHVFACIYTMKLQNDRSWLLRLTSSTISSNDIRSLTVKLCNDAFEHVDLPDTVKTIFDLASSTAEILAAGSIPKSLKSLHSALPNRTTRSVQLAKLDIFPTCQVIKTCKHHTTRCNHTPSADGCLCCGASVNGKPYCDCCTVGTAPNSTWNFVSGAAFSLLLKQIDIWLNKKKKIAELKVPLDLPPNPILQPTSHRQNKVGKPPPLITPSITKPSVPIQNNSLKKEDLLNVIRVALDKHNIKKKLQSVNQHAVELADIDNFDVVSEVVDPQFLCVAYGDETAPYNTEAFGVYLPFHPEDTFVIDNASVEIKGKVSIQNSSDNSCAYEAYKHVTMSSITLDEFSFIADSVPPFSLDDLNRVAFHEKLNLAVLTSGFHVSDSFGTQNTTITAMVCNATDYFYTLCLDVNSPSSIGHFSPVDFTFIVPPKYYKCEPTVDNLDRIAALKQTNKLSWLYSFEGKARQNIAVEFALALSSTAAATEGAKEVHLMPINRDTYIVNYDSTDVHRHRYNFKLSLVPELGRFITGESLDDKDVLFSSQLTYPKAIPADLTDLHQLEMINLTLKIVKIRRDILNNNTKSITYVNQKPFRVGDALTLRLKSGYLKPLDIVGLKPKSGGVTLSYVSKIVDGLIYVHACGLNEELTLMIHKDSFASCLKRIYSLDKAYKNGHHLDLLLANARAFDGCAGSGKSRQILLEEEPNTLVVTYTTAAKENLIKRGYNGSNIKTLERASCDDLSKYNNIVIDEANNLDYLDLSLIVSSKIERLSLYYDSTQIGKFDSVALQGIAKVQLITTYPTKIVTWRKSHRFGGDLARKLKIMAPNLEVNEDIDTTLILEQIDALDQDELLTKLHSHRPDVILVFYTNEQQIIQKWLDDISHDNCDMSSLPHVEKVHSYQGNEDDVILVLQWRNNTSDFGLCRDRNYVTSALTRAKKRCIVLTVGSKYKVTDIRHLVSSTGGAQTQLVTLTDHLDNSIEETVVLLNTHLAQDNCVARANSDGITIYGFGLPVGSYVKEDGVWRATSSIDFVRDMMQTSLTLPPGVRPTSKFDNLMRVDLSTTIRLRALLWVVDMIINDGKLHLGADFKGYTLKKTNGCPYMCGLSLNYGKLTKLHVTDGWITPLKRSLYYDPDDTLAVCLKQWLFGGESHTFLDKLRYDARIEEFMMLDRALTLPMAAISKLKGNTVLSAASLNDNAAWSSKVLSRHKMSTTKNWRSAVRHTLLIVKTDFLKIQRTTRYRLLGIHHDVTVTVGSNAIQWADFINIALSTIRPIMRREKLIGSSNGMKMSVEQHITHQTNVGKFVKKYKLQQTMRSIDNSKLNVVVSNLYEKRAHALLSGEKLNIAVTTHNASTPTSWEHELIDSYTLTKFANQGEGTSIHYFGLNLHLNPVANRHYVQLMQPPNKSALMVPWELSWSIAKVWYEEYYQVLNRKLEETQTRLEETNVSLSADQLIEEKILIDKVQLQLVRGIPVVTDTDKGVMCILGAASMYLDDEYILNCILNHEHTIIACDITHDPTCHDRNFMPEMSMTINRKLMNICKVGYGSLLGQEVKVDVLDALNGYNICKLTLSTTHVINVRCMSANNPFIALRLPELTITDGGKLKFIARVEKADKRILDRCLNYCVAHNPSFDKLMAYVRSLLSTYDTSRTGIFPTYNTTIELAQHAAIAALVLHKVDMLTVKSMSSLATNNVELLKTLLCINKEFNATGQLSDLISAVIERSLNGFGVNLRALIDAVDSIRVSIQPSSVRAILVCRFKSDCKSHVKLSDDGDSDYPDSDDDSNTSVMGSSTSARHSSLSINDDDDNSSQSSMSDDMLDSRHDIHTSYDAVKPISMEVDIFYDSCQTLVHDESSSRNQNVLSTYIDDDGITVADLLTLDDSPTAYSMPTTLAATVSGLAPNINSVDLTMSLPETIMLLFDDETNRNARFGAWMYWDANTDAKQNKLVAQMYAHNKKIVENLIMLNASNIHLYVPHELLALKEVLTIQCWADVVRCWLLRTHGGLWIDASCMIDPFFIDWNSNEVRDRGLLYYSKITNKAKYEFEVWLMMIPSKNDFFYQWARIFIRIVLSDNNTAKMCEMYRSEFGSIAHFADMSETYLTMNQASVLAQCKVELSNFLILPGFGGPLGWIGHDYALGEWVDQLAQHSYSTQGGAVKLFNIARELVAKLCDNTKKPITDFITFKKYDYDAIVFGIGTRGDVELALGLANNLRFNNLSVITVLSTNGHNDDDTIYLNLNVNFLQLSSMTGVSYITESAEMIRTLYKASTVALSNIKAKYLYGNLAIPTLTQTARLVGAVPVNYTAMPTFSLTEHESDTYFTMYKSNEAIMMLAVESITFVQAKELNLPWNIASINFGIKNLITIIPATANFVKPQLRGPNVSIIGNQIDGRNFADANDAILHSNLSGRTADLVVCGPNCDFHELNRGYSALSEVHSRNKILIIAGLDKCQLTKKARSVLLRNYTTLGYRVIPTKKLNLVDFITSHSTIVSHGGISTLSDVYMSNATHLSVGLEVDQPYWNNNHQYPECNLDQLSVVKRLHMVRSLVATDLNFANLLSLNGLHATHLLTSKGECIHNVVYDPQSPNFCTRHCYIKFCQENDVMVMDPALKLLTEYTLENQLIEACLMTGINCRLIKDGHYEAFSVNHSGVWMNVLLDRHDHHQHAMLVSITIIDGSESKLTQIMVDDPTLRWKYEFSVHGLNNCDTIIMKKLSVGDGWNHLIRDSMNQLKIQHSLNTKQLWSRAARSKVGGTLVSVHSKHKHICSINDVNVPSGKIFLVLCSTGVTLGYVIHTLSGERLMVTQTAIKDALILLIDIGCRLNTYDAVLRIKDESLIAKPLNIQTKNRLSTHPITCVTSTDLFREGDECVVVYEYDNRGHDKYDERHLIMSSVRQVWIERNDSPCTLTLFDKTYNRSLRLALMSGELSTVMDSDHYGLKWCFNALCTFLNLSVKFRNGLITSILPVELNEKFDSIVQKIEHQEEIHESVKELTKEQWMNWLNIDESKFIPLSSQCMVNKNGMYSSKIMLTHKVKPTADNWLRLMSDGFSIVASSTVFGLEHCVWLTKPMVGGVDDSDLILDGEITLTGQSRDWWHPTVFDNSNKKLDITPIPDVTIFHNDINELTASKWSNIVTLGAVYLEEPSEEVDIELVFDTDEMQQSDIFQQIVPHEIQNLWLNTDLSMDLRQYAPINPGTVRSRENPDRISTSTKSLLNEITPMESRPIISKWTFEEHRSVVGRLKSKVKYRLPEKTKSVNDRLKQIVRVYFIDGFVPYCEESQLLDVDMDKTRDWIAGRPDADKIQLELKTLLQEEIGVVPLNAINVHIKLESLLKEDPLMHWGQHQARAIFWQRKAIAALTSPVFLEVKRRLKESLRPSFIYADGMTPKQLSKSCRNTTGVTWFFENDLSKQDRQTDKPLIDVEMALYEVLGVSTNFISWWRTMHQTWKFKARWNSGYEDEMRLTGQSSTSIGNLITNMQVHADFFERNAPLLKKTLMLGDDMLAMFSMQPNVANLHKETKEAHNMSSISRLSQTCGLFCCMIVYLNHIGSCEIGPDYLRLRYRFEVTNGVSEASDANVLARCQSYACMLGAVPEVMAINSNLQWKLPLEEWYERANLIKAIQERYDLDEYTVLNSFNLLCARIRNPKVIDVEFITYTNVKKY